MEYVKRRNILYNAAFFNKFLRNYPVISRKTLTSGTCIDIHCKIIVMESDDGTATI